MALISGMGDGHWLPLRTHVPSPDAAFRNVQLAFRIRIAWIRSVTFRAVHLAQWKTVCKLASTKKTFFDPHQVEHIGHLIVLCLVVAVELPSTLTRINLSLAADPTTERQGVQWLRQFGSEEVMLRACYERSGRATDILGSFV